MVFGTVYEALVAKFGEAKLFSVVPRQVLQSYELIRYTSKQGIYAYIEARDMVNDLLTDFGEEE